MNFFKKALIAILSVGLVTVPATREVETVEAAGTNKISTNPSNRQLFDENDPHVIAYGRLQYGESVPEYTPFEVEFNYRDTQRVPRYIVIVASASKYGDFFTGGDGSVLHVDEFSLDYDY